MAFLKTTDLLCNFAERVKASNRIDIAVAWLGPSPALDELLMSLAHKKLTVRIIVGLSGNSTSPIALRSLLELGAQIRIGVSSAGIFHPKFYLFREVDRDTCWIGSANFTLSGFSRNSELVHEFYDVEIASQWFDDAWDSLPQNSDSIIDDYAENWTRPSPVFDPRPDNDGPPSDSFREILIGRKSWQQYVAELLKADRYWRAFTTNGKHSFSVLGDEWSWQAPDR